MQRLLLLLCAFAATTSLVGCHGKEAAAPLPRDESVAVQPDRALAEETARSGAGEADAAAVGGKEAAPETSDVAGLPEPEAVEDRQPAGPKAQPVAPSREEHMGLTDFARELTRVDLGMTQDEVRSIVGEPDDVQTPDDHAGTWLDRASSLWTWGSAEHNGPATLGAVYWNANGRVLAVYGGAGRLRPAEQRDRRGFAEKMAGIKVGRPADEVRAMLGAPDDVRTHLDPGGISTAETREIWCYGSAEHLGFPVYGRITIDDGGNTQYVMGGRGVPPDGFEEQALAELLRTIDHIGGLTGETFDPRPLIEAANALQPLGKERALDAIAEYLRVASVWHDRSREGVFLLLRALFEVPPDVGAMPVMMVGAPSPVAPTDAANLPRFPLVLVGDVPLLTVSGYMLAGHPEDPMQHVEMFRASGLLRASPLRPSDDVLALRTAADAKIAAAWPEHPEARMDVEQRVANQLLRLLEPVYRVDGRVSAWPLDSSDLDAAWSGLASALTANPVHWDPIAVSYVFAGGTTLPAVERMRYRRTVWPVEGTNGRVVITVERSDSKHIDVITRQRSGKGQLAVTSARLEPAEGGEALAVISWSATRTSGESVEWLGVPMEAGTAVRLAVEREGETVYSAVFQP